MKKLFKSYEQENLAAARIIAADPVRYAGIQTVWAGIVLAKQKAKAENNRRAAQVRKAA